MQHYLLPSDDDISIEEINRKMREDMEYGFELDFDRKPSKKLKLNTAPIELNTAPIIDIQKTEKSTNQTLQLINEKQYKVKRPSITDELTFDNLITAINSGYRDSLHLTFFGKNGLEIKTNNLQELGNAANKLTDEDKLQASDLLYAIQLQNEEIQKFVSLKPGR